MLAECGYRFFYEGKMQKYQMSNQMRAFLAVPTLVLWVAIYLTGFDRVHWMMYWVPVFFTFAIITKICPGLIVTELLFDKK